jgi:hypothetical protein
MTVNYRVTGRLSKWLKKRISLQTLHKLCHIFISSHFASTIVMYVKTRLDYEDKVCQNLFRSEQCSLNESRVACETMTKYLLRKLMQSKVMRLSSKAQFCIVLKWYAADLLVGKISQRKCLRSQNLECSIHPLRTKFGGKLWPLEKKVLGEILFIQLIKKLPTLYSNRKCIIVYKIRILPIKLSLSQLNPVYTHNARSILILSFHLCLPHKRYCLFTFSELYMYIHIVRTY